MLHCDATTSSFVAKSPSEVFAHFHVELRVWPARTNSLWTVFSGFGEFILFHWEDCCFVLVITINLAFVTSDNPGQEGCIVRGDLTKLLVDIDMLLLLISCHITPDAWLQIKGCKESACPPSRVTFVHRLPSYASTITIASHCYDSCTDGNTSARNYGYHLVLVMLLL
jgi:hypothetical protein